MKTSAIVGLNTSRSKSGVAQQTTTVTAMSASCLSARETDMIKNSHVDDDDDDDEYISSSDGKKLHYIC